MTHKEDLRITKTKKALSKAFFAMLSDMPLEEITVNELCECAGIRRATFYKHFNDKNDFLTYLIKDIRDSFDEECWRIDTRQPITKDYYIGYVGSVISFLLAHENAIRQILSSGMRATFIDIFMQQNYIDTKDRLERSVASGMKLPTSVDFVACMLIGGVSANVLRWFESGSAKDAELLLKETSDFIDSILKQA